MPGIFTHDDWNRPLSEPARRKSPLPIAAMPSLFAAINWRPEYRLAVMETGDIANVRTAILFPRKKGLAQVAITERRTFPTAIVSITQRRDGVE